MNEANENLHIGRLDGYLDALSIVNGGFRQYRYSACIEEFSINTIEKDISCKYAPECDVSFGEIAKKEKWLQYLQQELESHLITSPFCKIINDEEKKNRIYQIAWYVMEMVRVLSNDFESKIMYQCSIKLACKSTELEGIIYIIPVGNRALFINLHKQVSA